MTNKLSGRGTISAAKKAPRTSKYRGGGAPGDWSVGMEAALKNLRGEERFTARQIADAINERHGTDLTANAVRQKLSQMREEKSAARPRWPEKAKRWLSSRGAEQLTDRDAAEALNSRFGLQTTPAAIHTIRARIKRRAQ
jgi:hypothetical protein